MKRRPRVLSIGSAVQDVFLQGKVFAAHRSASGTFMEQFIPGSKNELEKVTYSTGGGATNAAVTFARHGFKSSFIGKLGRDIAGRAVLEALHKDGVVTSQVSFSESLGTGYSVLMLAPNGERTILTYRGASADYRLRARQLAHSKADWIYMSSLSGDFESLRLILRFAKRRGIKIAINPGRDELERPRDLLELMPYITILSLNKEESQQLFKGQTSVELAAAASAHVPIVIITDGSKGAVACDGHQLYQAGLYKDVPIIDRTGAGDAFSSGFTASLIAGQPIERAIVFASANSTSVVGKLGAKAGILPARSRLQSMSVVARPLHRA